MVHIPTSTNCGVTGLTGSLVRCIHTRTFKSRMGLLEILAPNNSVKMRGATKLLVNFPSMQVSNVSEFMRFGIADCHVFPIPGILIYSAGGEVLVMKSPM